jgi:hypothetical protein
MNERCEPLETLPAAAALPVGDARRDHVDDCARCRARLAAYAAFMAADDAADDAGADRAERRLSAFLRAEIRGEPTATPTGPFPLLRFATGALALAAVLVLLVVVPRFSTGPETPGVAPLLRGDEAADPLAPRVAWGENGISVLSWTALEGADDYVVVLFDAALQETARFHTQGRTFWSLVPTRAASPPLLWRVDAYARGDPLASSRTCALAATDRH